MLFISSAKAVLFRAMGRLTGGAEYTREDTVRDAEKLSAMTAVIQVKLFFFCSSKFSELTV